MTGFLIFLKICEDVVVFSEVGLRLGPCFHSLLRASSNDQLVRIHHHICCTWKVFLLCESLNAFSGCLAVHKWTCKLHTWTSSPFCEFFHVSSGGLQWRKRGHTYHICKVFHGCAFACASSGHPPQNMNICTDNTCLVFHHCGFACAHIRKAKKFS